MALGPIMLGHQCCVTKLVFEFSIFWNGIFQVGNDLSDEEEGVRVKVVYTIFYMKRLTHQKKT